MKLLERIQDKKCDEIIKTRKASRAVLFDENDLVPILFVTKHNFHKLPGGGIEKGESKKQALKRECLEEIGSNISIEGKLGKVVEIRAKWGFKQISYGYYGRVLSKGLPSFTEKEKKQGFKLKWVRIKQAIKLIQKDNTAIYQGQFIQKRALVLLKALSEKL